MKCVGPLKSACNSHCLSSGVLKEMTDRVTLWSPDVLMQKFFLLLLFVLELHFDGRLRRLRVAVRETCRGRSFLTSHLSRNISYSHLLLSHPRWLAVRESFLTWIIYLPRGAHPRIRLGICLGIAGKRPAWTRSGTQHVSQLASHLTSGPESKWPPPPPAD